MTNEKRVYDVVGSNIAAGKLTAQVDETVSTVAILKVLAVNALLDSKDIANTLKGAYDIQVNGNVVAWRISKYLASNGLVTRYPRGKKYIYTITNLGRDCLFLIESGNDFYRVLKVGRILSGAEL